MASAPATGLVDASGRLVAADSLLARLQEEAGAGIGASLAVPQLAAIARLVQKLGVTVSRHALAGTRDADLDLWVRAEPQDGSVRLTIERWTERPPQPQRWPEPDDREDETPGGDQYEVDAQLRLTSLAPALARRLGSSAAAALGAPLTKLLRLEAADDGSLPLLTAVLARGGFDDQQARPADGTDALIILSGQPIDSPDGSFLGFRGRMSFTDAEGQALAPAAPAFDELLREPLDAIISEAQQIATRSEGPLRSDYAAYASDIAGAARHLLDVLQSMGREPVEEHDRLDLAVLAVEAIGLVQPQATERNIRLQRDGPEKLPARGQARAITQILVNLIGNAVRHSPESGVVRVSLTSGSSAAVTVVDEGPGVAETDRERIFERFEQAEPRGDGAGLGLAISRRLAQSLGGDISLDSAPGEGARFTLSLPSA